MPNGDTTLAKIADDNTQVRMVATGQQSSSQILDITEEQYQDLLQQAATHTMKFDTITNTIMLSPHQQPTSEASQ